MNVHYWKAGCSVFETGQSLCPGPGGGRTTFISKNYYMRPERAVHQTLRTLRTSTVTQDAIPYLPLRPRRPDNVHHQAHASRCPQTLSSPASRRSPSCASLVMGESNSTLASGRLSGCLVF